ncbi:MAG: hypothetical protein GX962_03365 [Epulopiscium sp.]|nr:hypothetical protein [Candidatus Epulonipiscium sp.]
MTEFIDFKIMLDLKGTSLSYEFSPNFYELLEDRLDATGETKDEAISELAVQVHETLCKFLSEY